MEIQHIGPAASTTEAATDFTSASASTMFRLGGGLGTGVAATAADSTDFYISNATAPFTGGTGGSFTLHLWFSVIPVS